MSAAIEARRNVLRAITKPKLEDYLAHCDRRTLDLVASFQRALVNDLGGERWQRRASMKSLRFLLPVE